MDAQWRDKLMQLFWTDTSFVSEYQNEQTLSKKEMFFFVI